MLEAARLALGVTPQLIARTRVTERTAVLDKLLPALIQVCWRSEASVAGAGGVGRTGRLTPALALPSDVRGLSGTLAGRKQRPHPGKAWTGVRSETKAQAVP